jgi:acylglycerol lipase
MEPCYDAAGVVLACVFGVLLGLVMLKGLFHLCDGRQRSREFPPPERDPRYPYFQSSKTGLWLYRRVWMPPVGTPVRALLVLAHGYAEYTDRYDFAAQEFAKQGVAVWGLDFEAHGKSDGERGFVGSWGFSTWADDLEQGMALAAEEVPDVPMYVMGHSLGGLIVTMVMSRMPPPPGGVPSSFEGGDMRARLRGVLLSAPALEVDPKVAKPHLVAIASCLGRCLPRLQLGTIPVEELTPDPLWNDHYSRDVLINTEPFSARFGLGVLQLTAEVDAMAPHFQWPLLGMQDAEDRVTIPGTCARFIAKCASKDTEFTTLSGYKHELLMAAKAPELIGGTIVPWMKRRCGTEWNDLPTSEESPEAVRAATPPAEEAEAGEHVSLVVSE